MNRLSVFFLTLAALSGTAAKAQSPGSSRPVPALDEAFKRVDANKDAKLDPKEFGKFIERSRSMSGANAAEVFTKLDTNKDGALTLEEFRKVTAVSRGSPAPPSPKPEPTPTKPEATPTKPVSASPAAPTPSTSRPVPALDEAFKRVDANKDSKLDPKEFAKFIERSRSLSGANAVEVFGKLDTNKDGALTLEEFRGITAVSRGSPAPPSPKPESTPTTPQPAPTPTKPEPAPTKPAPEPAPTKPEPTSQAGSSRTV